MKKTEIEKLRNKTIEELMKEKDEMRKEIAKLQLDFKVNRPKETNLLVKKRKKLAVMLTMIGEKKRTKQNVKKE